MTDGTEINRMNHELSESGARRAAFSVWGKAAAPAAACALALAAAAGFLSPTLPVFAQTGAAEVVTPSGRAPLTFADIVEKVKPAVVSVTVTNGGKLLGKGRGGVPGLPDLPDDHPLNEFFKNLPKEWRNIPIEPRPVLGQGSGFLISGDGYAVTNNHVVDGASKIEVSFDNGDKYDADLVGSDSRTDLAVIRIKAPNKTFPHVKFAEKPGRVGDWVLSIGNPFGLGGTVTAGILSAQARDIGSGPYDYIQVDSAVNRGNSGGPTFNLDGDVIGVNTAIYSPSGGSVGIAFAIPASTAKEVVAQLIKDGTVSRGWLGVKIQDVDADIAASLGLKEAKGALVSEVTANGPAAASGVKERDAILEVNGVRIENSRDLARKIAEFSPGTTVDIKLWRNNNSESLKVKLGRFPSSQEEIAKLEREKPAAAAATDLSALGLTLAPGRAETGGAAIAEVDPDSDAARKGLKAGDTILNINDKTVNSPEDVVAEVKKANELGRKAVLLSVKSGDQTRFVGVQLNSQPKKG